jgi:hypothetical protein
MKKSNKILYQTKYKELTKEYFDHMMKECRTYFDKKREFDDAIYYKFGYHYYQIFLYKGLEPLEIGQGDMTYEEFCKLMISNTPSTIP